MDELINVVASIFSVILIIHLEPVKELYHLQQQQVGHVQRQQYLGTPNVNSNSLKMYG